MCMSPQHLICRAIEPDLLSVAAGETGSAAAGRVEAHLAGCQLCRDELAHDRTLEDMMDSLRHAAFGDDAALAHAKLVTCLFTLHACVGVVGGLGGLTGSPGGLAHTPRLLALKRSTM